MSSRGHMANSTDNASVGGDGMSLAKDDVMAARDGLVAGTQIIPLVAENDVPRAGAFDSRSRGPQGELPTSGQRQSQRSMRVRVRASSLLDPVPGLHRLAGVRVCWPAEAFLVLALG
ncbi:hypothetical protein THAOC_10130 [Thalassiosira oceanica]|uniref:Uncharacterized protein n=1 Tax=Thalassiosira oceanica TaxID=159749 RepID=K0SUS7_THAOC|nr:hypothetical protein THAOC_10130 [Thalassiosira oceanica]|eukprot:EJK68669.1 hypothetical protein THAOC_10130 [Thalassiosira oceanica]